MRPGEISAAIDGCYDAVVDPASWPDALHGLAHSIDAAACMFFPQDPDETLLRVPASPVFSEFLEDFVGGGWWLDDHRAERAFQRIDAGQSVIIEHDIVSDEERGTMPVYEELYFQHRLPWWAGLGFRLNGRLWGLTTLRPAAPGPFTREQAGRMAPIAPHLRRMMSISEKLTAGRIGSTLDILDCMSVAALAIDWRGRAMRMNHLAAEMMGDGIRLAAGGRLCAFDPRGNANLQRLVAAAIAPEAADCTSRAGAVSAEPVALARSRRRPLIVEAMPASGLFGDVLQQARALVFITDPGRPGQVAPERLRVALGVTPAEARLMARLACGDDLAGAAAALGISVHTARSQLKALFAKTGTHRQTELVTLAERIGSAPRME